MITITESARQELAKYFEGKTVEPIRVHLADGGCAGPRLSLALDQLRDGDTSVEQGDFTFLIQTELAEATGAVTIDMTEYGFQIASENLVGGGGCGCSSSGGCSSGSCGC